MLRLDRSYWNRFLNEIADAIVDLGSPDTVWYRGVNNSSHVLRPTLLRYGNGVLKERELFERFSQISRVTGMRFESSDNEWDILFQMQHFGIPTRLLDWSEVFGVSLFFATLTHSNDSYIYVLNPKKLNEMAGKSTLLEGFERESFRYREIFWEGKPFKPSVPMAINPAHSNPRLAAQTGRFTIHGVDVRALEDVAPDCVRKIKLPLDAVQPAFDFLKMAGINEFRVFPDVGGAAPFIKNLVGLI